MGTPETNPVAKQRTKILRWWDGHVLWEGDGTLPEVLARAIEAGADLRSADLRSADLGSAALGSANLRSADLRSADLRSADLGSANLRGADLRSADLGGADLRSADLGSANLRGADLGSADLGGANLRSANLRSADLGSANLGTIRDDLYQVLAAAPREVPGLLAALKAGRVDGSTYSGECACLVGTIANVAKCSIDSLPGITPDANRPAERWFLAIRPGHTPDSSQVCAITASWVEEWLAAHPTPADEAVR